MVVSKVVFVVVCYTYLCSNLVAPIPLGEVSTSYQGGSYETSGLGASNIEYLADFPLQNQGLQNARNPREYEIRQNLNLQPTIGYNPGIDDQNQQPISQLKQNQLDSAYRIQQLTRAILKTQENIMNLKLQIRNIANKGKKYEIFSSLPTQSSKYFNNNLPTGQSEARQLINGGVEYGTNREQVNHLRLTPVSQVLPAITRVENTAPKDTTTFKAIQTASLPIPMVSPILKSSSIGTATIVTPALKKYPAPSVPLSSPILSSVPEFTSGSIPLVSTNAVSSTSTLSATPTSSQSSLANPINASAQNQPANIDIDALIALTRKFSENAANKAKTKSNRTGSQTTETAVATSAATSEVVKTPAISSASATTTSSAEPPALPMTSTSSSMISSSAKDIPDQVAASEQAIIVTPGTSIEATKSSSSTIERTDAASVITSTSSNSSVASSKAVASSISKTNNTSVSAEIENSESGIVTWFDTADPNWLTKLLGGANSGFVYFFMVPSSDVAVDSAT